MASIVETNYFGGFNQTEDPKVLVIPVPYEYTPAFIKGTKNGPQAILNASKRLEAFDDELWTDISKIGINTANPVICDFVSNKSTMPFMELEQAIRNSVINGQMPVIIGGEQALSFGTIKSIYDLYPDVSILSLTARPHLKNTFENNKYSSPCVFRRITETMPDIKLIQLSVRSVSNEEKHFLETSKTNIEIYLDKDKKEWNVSEILSNLTKNVFISFNFNSLNSAVMPSCAMPEPGGLSYELALDILKNICTFKEIVGLEFTEFSPIPGFLAPDFLAAKLIYKTIGYTFAKELGVFEESNLAAPLSIS